MELTVRPSRVSCASTRSSCPMSTATTLRMNASSPATCDLVVAFTGGDYGQFGVMQGFAEQLLREFVFPAAAP
jgi:hypothetical protein